MTTELERLRGAFVHAMKHAHKEDAAHEVAELVSDYVGGLTFDPLPFAEHVTTHIHRTLQQAMFRLFMQCVVQWADQHDKGFSDLRNKFTGEVSVKLLAVLEEASAAYNGKASAPRI